MSSMTELNLAPSSEGDERELLSASDATIPICGLQWEQPVLSQPARETGQMRCSCGSKCVLTGTRTVGYGSSEQIPDACLTAQSLGARQRLTSSRCCRRCCPFFFLRAGRQKVGTASKLATFWLQFEMLATCCA